MPKFTHLTRDEKDEICLLKLDGLSGSKIAQQLGKTRQSISNYLNSLPGSSGQEQSAPYSLPTGISRTDAFAVCRMFNAGLKMSKIMYLSELSEPVIYQIFAYVRKPHPTGTGRKSDNLFPEVTDWMRANGMTYQMMAEQLGVSIHVLRNTLYGKTHLSDDVADRIKEVTGISLVP